MTQAASSRRILCFGEMLLRFSPNQNELLMQSPAVTIRPAGAEANVAVSLANFGAPTSMATVLADNALGRGVRDEVRKHGVDTSPIVFKPGRMGLYFLTPGAVRRPSEVLYDRAGSAFVEHVNTAFDWDTLLDGVEWLHASGVTPATGANGSAAAVAIIEAAVRKGVKVSYDGNFRRKLWEQWDGELSPAHPPARAAAAAVQVPGFSPALSLHPRRDLQHLLHPETSHQPYEPPSLSRGGW